MISYPAGSRITLQSKTKVYTVQPMPRPICQHRGHVLDGNKCPYHGLTSPIPDSCFVSEPVSRGTFDITWCESIEDDLGQAFFTYDMPVKTPAHLWMQNVMDHHHVPIIHKDSFARQFASHIPYDVCIGNKASSHRLRVKPEVIEVYKRLCGDGVSDNFYQITEYPHLSVTNFLNVFYSFETVKAVSANECRVTTKFFRSKNNRSPSVLSEAYIEANKEILKEDRAIMESWAGTYHDHKHVNWLPGEDRIKHYVEYHSSFSGSAR